MKRRAFLAALAAAATGAVFDPEKLLWVPGRKSYFDLGAVPKAERDYLTGLDIGLKAGDVFTIEGVYDINPPDGRLREFVIIDAADSAFIRVERLIPPIEPPILVGKHHAKTIATWRPPVKRSRQERAR